MRLWNDMDVPSTQNRTGAMGYVHLWETSLSRSLSWDRCFCDLKLAFSPTWEMWPVLLIKMSPNNSWVSTLVVQCCLPTCRVSPLLDIVVEMVSSSSQNGLQVSRFILLLSGMSSGVPGIKLLPAVYYHLVGHFEMGWLGTTGCSPCSSLCFWECCQRLLCFLQGSL